MSYVLWTFASVLAYIGGLIIILRVTPRLLYLRYDEGLFMGIAALCIFGALLAFGAIAVTFGLFNGNFGARVLDFLFLIGILIAAGRTAWYSFRPRYGVSVLRSSSYMAGFYCLALALVALVYITQLFVPAG